MSLENLLKIIPENSLKEFKEFIACLSNQKNKFLLRNDILVSLENCGFFDKARPVYKFINKVQELLFTQDHIVFMYRYDIAKYRFLKLRVDCTYLDDISLAEYLNMKDEFILGHSINTKQLEIDYIPFYDYTPNIKDAKKIGHGINFLNRYLSSIIFHRPQEWNQKIFNFIKLHKYNEQQLLVNDSIIKDFDIFYEELNNMLEWLKSKDQRTAYQKIESDFKKNGFEPGWGNDVKRISENMQLLVDLLNEPSDTLFEKFINHVPMPLISKIAILSPHGWFAQENVLGRPDTGGQVIYILDQVKALEKYLKKQIAKSGLSVTPQIIVVTRFIPDADCTSCNIRKEKIYDSENCWILRVPFKDENDKIINHWISRFEIWPYLEKFANDATSQLVSAFQGKPDLIIGNYSDGNLVASLISDQLGVILCTIAHALEKTKYLFSDLYWKNFENEYNFSKHFVADMLAMNKSDFVIASTHQEVIGTEESIGQYESYQFFTMPGLMQVRGGINLFAPKFNVIPPGVNEDMYFPYNETEKRIINKKEFWEKRIFHSSEEDTFGSLKDVNKIPIFTMARLDRIKNITGLVEAFGMSKYLQEKCNLVIAAGHVHFKDSSDREEQEEITKVYDLINKYKLEGKIRWLPSIQKIDTGEVYRIIADHNGIFVQPALFEAFGLTILEAMLSGLPTVATKFGGPLEIIEVDKSGYLINTSDPQLIANDLDSILEKLIDEKKWKYISEGGIKRVLTSFTWELYSQHLINQTKLYGFWRYAVASQGKKELDRYSDLIYHFLFKQRV